VRSRAAGLSEAVAGALGVAVTGAAPVSGGDINEAFALSLADGRSVFVKTHPQAPRGMFAAEARGLGWLAEAAALRVPEVLAVASEPGGPSFLVLEHIIPATRRRDFDQLLGHGLAALHRRGPGGFGLDHDNFIGRLPQANGACPDWPSFYRERRLEPQLRLAVDRGLASASMRAGFTRLFADLEDLVGPPEPPARLHGDLWGGNLIVDDTGGPCLIDPAVYGGHREVDLAMMRLFGGFGEHVFRAYDEVHPLAAGAAERIPLYQLYFLLVHVNLFGGGYVASVEAALGRLV
jgi:fructosamine-3-kinase